MQYHTRAGPQKAVTSLSRVSVLSGYPKLLESIHVFYSTQSVDVYGYKSVGHVQRLKVPENVALHLGAKLTFFSKDILVFHKT